MHLEPAAPQSEFLKRSASADFPAGRNVQASTRRDTRFIVGGQSEGMARPGVAFVWVLEREMTLVPEHGMHLSAHAPA